VVIVQQLKDKAIKKRLENVLESLSSGIVLVEGKNDVKALKEIGISEVYTYDMLRYGNVDLDGGSKVIYILTDNDRKGEQKVLEFKALLSCSEYKINTDLRREFFKVLRIVHVEEAASPAKKIMEKGD